ncbi:MAG: bifunctional DNA-formamidopyrimidine glycosylase/DNA-(apurinic or apyrimidinic site) lyase [Gammaproteobacteria bacterium]|nr:bifunctional DNA-formamidopyrimidine glycosylase/DNA-(apurinic or apyrimidinic site) lyase [Gammaproteobacteria bacterium]
MPELPEVETTRRGIEPHLLDETVVRVIVRDHRLRWPVPKTLNKKLQGQKIEKINRRGKYILLQVEEGTTLIHLGMSGSLRIIDAHTPAEKHDHIDIVVSSGKCLRMRDPRRFGSVLWAGKEPLKHKLLQKLGPEPLSDEFTSDYIYTKSRQRNQAIKTFIMDSHLVVGVGNIYASEALFRCGIHPKRAAGKVSMHRYKNLVDSIREVLSEAIDNGGTTLRDFVSSEGTPGYFAQKLNVYGRKNEPCHSCNTAIRQITLGQRSTFYCPDCQH